MSMPPNILAAADLIDPATVKIIVAVLAAGFWIVTNVLSSKTRKPDRRVPPAPGPTAPPAPTVRQRARVAPPPIRPQTARVNWPSQPQIRPSRPVPAMRKSESMYRQTPAMPPRSAPLASRPASVPPVSLTGLAPTAEYHGLAESVSRSLRDTGDAVARPVKAAPAILPRSEFLDALLQPRNLKKVYILNELLQPPLSLRNTPENPGRFAP